MIQPEEAAPDLWKANPKEQEFHKAQINPR